MKFEEWINAKGFDGAALSETQRTSLEAAFDAEQKTAAPDNRHRHERTPTPSPTYVPRPPRK